MNNYYVTFGYGQYLGILRNSYIHFLSPNDMIVRQVMKEHFGNKYAMIYTDDTWKGQVDEHGLTCIAVMDQFGNKIKGAA